MISPEQRRQLEILGYTRPESRVRIRCFIAKGMPLNEQLTRGAAWQKDDLTIIPTPVDGWLYLDGTFVQLKKKRCGGQVVLDSNGNSIWIENKTYKNGIAYLRAVNTKGYGIYLIPNEGGGADADIIRFPALFYECDQISKDEQRQRLRSLESKLERSASMVVETRNSLHCYFALSYDKLLSSTWRHYQQRLIQQQESDDGIWNPARLMRLVGFDHQKWNQETLKLEQFPVRLAWESDDIFALDDFDQVLPQWNEQRWKPKQQSERAATSPVDNPWDIRNFVHYLDGYKVNGRAGWDTCKCPAHNGESDNSLHINQSTGATKCHSGCDPKDVYHAALELAKSRGYQVPQQRSGYQFSDLGGWLFKLKQQLAKTVERRSNWGFDRKSKVEVEPSPALAAPAIEYQAGEQLAAWSEAVRRKAKYILVNDATGCGKSYHAGMVTPERVEANGIAYVSSEHRNPSTPTLQSWTVLEGRHQGLYHDEFGRLRRADKGQPYVVPPSCGRNGVADALRSKNIVGADTSALLCQDTCPDADLCKIGVKFGHLYNRANTLKQSRFIAYPSSLPEPSEYDYSDKVLIWDEPGQILQAHRSISVRASDLQRTIADLAVKSPEVFDALRPLLTTIHKFMSGEIKQPNKFGCKDFQIRAAMPKPEGVDIEALSAALMPNPDSLLNHTKEYGVDLADLKRSERKRFSEKDATTAARIQEELALNWLPDFLNTLLGYEVGYLHINHGILTITIPERRLSEIARAAKSNIFLDATGTAEDLARVLGIAPSEILTMRQSIPDTSNLEIVQVATMGRLGVGSRRKDKDGEDTLLQKRVDALISQIQQDNPGKVGIIDFKRHTSNGDGKRHWWVDSRGVNDLEDCDALVMVGTPCRNLSDLEAEFTILYGRPPQEGTERVKYPVQVNGQPSPDLQPWFEMEVSIDLEFRAFVRRRILADIHQCIGRLRAHRRPEKQLKVCFIADYPLDVPVTLKKASHVTPEAATKVERVEMAIRDAVEQLRATKQKITQSAIATITGYSQQYVSKFRVLLLLLLDKPYSKSSKNGEPPPDPGEIEFNGQIYLPLLAQESPEEILKGMLAIYESHGQAVFKAIWSATPAAIQIKILKTLLLILPASELRTLATAAGVKL